MLIVQSQPIIFNSLNLFKTIVEMIAIFTIGIGIKKLSTKQVSNLYQLSCKTMFCYTFTLIKKIVVPA